MIHSGRRKSAAKASLNRRQSLAEMPQPSSAAPCRPQKKFGDPLHEPLDRLVPAGAARCAARLRLAAAGAARSYSVRFVLGDEVDGDLRCRRLAAGAVTHEVADVRTVGDMTAPTQARHERLQLRLSPSDDGLIRAAAAAADLSLTEFVLRAARASAVQTLADRDHVVLDPETWDLLEARIRERGKPNPKVAELFSRPAAVT